MKFILILSLVAVYGFVAVASFEEPDVAVEPDTNEEVEVAPPVHPLLRAKRVTCDIGSAVCNMHCQWKGYARGNCVSKTCSCSGYSG